jgi:hypothetical protein
MAMSEIVNLKDRRRKLKREIAPATITLIVDGKSVEYVNFDALSDTERAKIFSEAPADIA